jgi:toxin ParE1/3/4
MSRRLVLLRQAEVDIDETVSRYERERVGLGVRFLQGLNVLLERVEENPFQFPVVHENTRRGLLSRFPYGVFFTADDEEILVVAVVHLHRHPDTWKRR